MMNIEYRIYCVVFVPVVNLTDKFTDRHEITYLIHKSIYVPISDIVHFALDDTTYSSLSEFLDS